jgi:hypothetical protein
LPAFDQTIAGPQPDGAISSGGTVFVDSFLNTSSIQFLEAGMTITGEQYTMAIYNSANNALMMTVTYSDDYPANNRSYIFRLSPGGTPYVRAFLAGNSNIYIP